MQEAIHLGLHTEGFFPGKLKVKRKAKSLIYSQKKSLDSIETHQCLCLCVSEVNASGGLVVTAPTYGTSGVLPSVLYYLIDVHKYNDESIMSALATAGIIGNIIKHNGSISGSEAGCQAEIGSACAMAAAAYTQLESGDLSVIEYAAEIALEHHLGLTCDTIVETMKETGHDINESYRETSKGGLAKNIRLNHKNNIKKNTKNLHSFYIVILNIFNFKRKLTAKIPCHSFLAIS